MDCPFCGKEMRAGRIPANSFLVWYDNEEESLWDKGVQLNESFKDAQAFFCPDCRQIVMPVPEVEDLLDKMQKKIDAAAEKIGEVQKQWEERRTQAKKQKEKEKFGAKDPWEL